MTLSVSGAISYPGGDAFTGRKGVEQDHQASATDPGSDDLIFDWSFETTHTYYNDGVAPDPYPSPGGIFPFTATDSATVIFNAPGLYTIAVEVTDDDTGTDSTELPKIVTDDYLCTRSQGFWRHQFGKGKQQIDDETPQAYLDIVNFASAVFSEKVPASTLEEAGQVMWFNKDDDEDDNGDNSEMRKKAQAQLLAAWLNYSSGAIQWTELIEIDDDDGISLPFYQLMAEAEEILLNPDASHEQLEYVNKDLAEAINELDEDNPVCEDIEEDTEDGGDVEEEDIDQTEDEEENNSDNPGKAKGKGKKK